MRGINCYQRGAFTPIVFYSVCVLMIVTAISFAGPFTPGNILVTQNNVLLEYTRKGELVQDIVVPHPDTGRRDATDICVDQYGRAYVLNIAPFDNDYLSIFDPTQESWTHHLVQAYLGNISDGDLSLSLDETRIFTKTQAISLEDFTTEGIVVPGRGVAEITVGYDGSLYALDSGSPRHGVRILDPESYEVTGTLTLRDMNQRRLNARGIAVTVSGDIFVSAWDGYFYAYDRSALLMNYAKVGSSFNDLDLSPVDGFLAAGSRFGTVAVVDTSFQSVFTFQTRGRQAYVCFVPMELQENTAPVADAGDDKVVYAWVDGVAEVQLDGTGSCDADGDLLSYSWYVDANELIATGAEPNVWFEPGVYEIDLVVNDGLEDSEPNSCVVTVVEALEAEVRVMPKTLNVKRQCRQMVAWMTLPEGVGVDDIEVDEPLLLLPGDVEPVRQRIVKGSWSTGGRVSIVAFYDVDDLGELSGGTSLNLIQATRLISGQTVYGTDSIRVIDPKPHSRPMLQRESKPGYQRYR